MCDCDFALESAKVQTPSRGKCPRESNLSNVYIYINPCDRNNVRLRNVSVRFQILSSGVIDAHSFTLLMKKISVK